MTPKTLLLFAMLLGWSASAWAQTQLDVEKAANPLLAQSPVQWLTLADALAQTEERAKPFFIFMYRPGCAECDEMLRTTLANEGIASYISRNFYPVLFNRKVEGEVPFSKQLILANQLNQLEQASPLIAFIDRDGAGEPTQGFKTLKQLEPYLVYYAEEVNKTLAFDKYLEYYHKVYPPDDTTGVTMVRSVVRWMDLDEAFELQATDPNPKKIFIDLYADWRTTSTIMFMSTYNNPIVGAYLNEHFYPVRIDATTHDTIVVKGVTYTNNSEGQGHPFHDLAIAMLEGRMFLPANLFLNEQGNVIQKVQIYQTPETFEPLVKFFGSDAYLGTQYEDYLESFQSALPPKTP